MIKTSSEFWLRITVVIFFVGIILLVPSILFPFAISLILSILLTPIAEFIHKGIVKIGLKRFPYDLSIGISFITFIAILYLMIIHILLPFITEAKLFLNSLSAALEEIQSVVPVLIEKYDMRFVPPEMQQLVSNIVNYIGTYTLRIAQFSLVAIFSVASTLIEMIAVPFITFYMMKKGSTFKNAIASLFPVQYQSHLTRLMEEMYGMLCAYVRGQLILSVLMAFVTFLGMIVLEIPYPLVIGLLAGVVELIPIIGPIVGAIPPMLLGLLQSSSVMIKVIIFYVIVQQLDAHIIMPKLMGSVIKVHPVAIIAGVLIGGHLYGIIGMMAAVPVLAIVQVIIRHMWFYDYYKVVN